jgi:hypothetical protein
MREYQGQTNEDKIVGGGRYVKIQKRGEEVCNFVAFKGKSYGYVQPVGEQIKLEKIGASRDAEKLIGVDIVVTARAPGGGTVIVGWYKNATVYRFPQPIAVTNGLHKTNKVKFFRYEADASQIKLLPPDMRVFGIPRGKGGMGQSNVWYAEKVGQSWLDSVRAFIDSANIKRPMGRKRPPPDHFKNTQVEQAAMRHVWKYYANIGYRTWQSIRECRA